MVIVAAFPQDFRSAAMLAGAVVSIYAAVIPGVRLHPDQRIRLPVEGDETESLADVGDEPVELTPLNRTRGGLGQDVLPG